MGKRKGSKGGKGGGSKRRKGGLSKNARKAKAQADWYTNDGATGIYGSLSKKNDKSGEREESAAGQRSGKRRRERDGLLGSRNGIANGFEDADSDGEVEWDQDDNVDSDDAEEEPDAAYQGLLSSLTSAENSLALSERGVLDRVRREQEGIEEDDDDDDEDVDEDEEDENGEGNKMQESEIDNAANAGSHGSDVEEDDEEGDEDEDAGAEMAESGHFEERFVKNYGFDEDSLERLADQDAQKNPATKREKMLQRKSKSKILVGTSKLKCIALGADADAMVNRNEFTAERVRKDNEDALVQTHEIRTRLAKSWLAYAERRHRICKDRLGEDRVPPRNAFGFTALQNALVEPLKRYTDINFGARDLGNASELRELYVLHVLNHVMKSRDLVTKHNARLRIRAEKQRRAREAAKVARGQAASGKSEEEEEEEEEEEDNEAAENDDLLDDVVRDQGFTRPQALILVPTRHAALRVMRVMLEVLPSGTSAANKSRIFSDYCEEGGEELPDVAKRVRRESATAGEAYDELFYDAEEHPFLRDDEARKGGAGGGRPADWHDVFTGNSDECFRIGVALNGRKSVRFFADFYKADIIIASPLGIRLATGQEIGDAVENDQDAVGRDSGGEEEEEVEEEDNLADLGINTREQLRREERRKEKESADFLSSIEVCVIDQAEMIQMQNWQHLIDTMSAVNRKPIELRDDMDFSRIRPLSLVDGLPRRFRQTIVCSAYPDPFINALTAPRSSTDLNLAGQLTVRRAAYSGVLEDVDVDGIAHKFVRVETDSDDRLEYFSMNVLPALQRQAAAHTMVVVPSYLDFVSVRKLFRDAAHSLGEEGERAMGKPWRRQRKNRVRDKSGKRLSHTETDGEIEPALFVSVTEYSETDQITRARGDFFHGRARILLTTERFHFYNRFRLRGIHRLVFYAPPLNAHFYSELANLIEPSAEPSSNLVLFDKREAMALERIAGTTAALHMLKGTKRVFTFTTGA
ncbi:U3 small nucleolar RNA-associated protein 25 [Hondaea fermentalgiana]|uniref:U3 small nucleolar RNA-associated protein 25 n=1 Tax=Hondaea fermentalgiana TaxID=2315210 RepID=A0A2R5G509_9STRA|nr:U3 small nucleolar RNA-associated protein 25 [Hondaea fermentalgiana]|eukprot:GBG25635.1 U3 small nucleolar RNA-associated protein 25 [Hondaea fermentalgiana]